MDKKIDLKAVMKDSKPIDKWYPVIGLTCGLRLYIASYFKNSWLDRLNYNDSRPILGYDCSLV